MFEPWTKYVWSKSGALFFFSRHAQPSLGLWLRALQCEWINILLRTPSIRFLLDRNALRFSFWFKGNPENQAQCDCSFFYLLLVASLRFGLVYLCIQFVFSATALHFLVRWIRRLIALWSKGVYISSLHPFCENNPEPWPVFFFVNWQMKTSFSITIMGSYTSENNCSCQWRRESTGHMYDINGLACLSFWWLSSFCGTKVSLRISVV